MSSIKQKIKVEKKRSGIKAKVKPERKISGIKSIRPSKENLTEVVIEELGDKYHIYDESGQMIEGDFRNYNEAKKWAKDNEYVVGESFNFKNGGSMEKGGDIAVSELSTRLGIRKEAVQNWLDKNGLSKEDALKILTGLGRVDLFAGDVMTAIVGKENNKYSVKLVKYVKSDRAYAYQKGGSMAKGGVIEYSVIGNDIEEHFEDMDSAIDFYNSLTPKQRSNVQFFSKEWNDGEEGEVIIFRNKTNEKYSSGGSMATGGGVGKLKAKDIKEGKYYKTSTGRIGQAYAVSERKLENGFVDLFFEGEGDLTNNPPSGSFRIESLTLAEKPKSSGGSMATGGGVGDDIISKKTSIWVGRMGYDVDSDKDLWNLLVGKAQDQYNDIVEVNGINKRLNTWIKLLADKHGFKYPYYQKTRSSMETGGRFDSSHLPKDGSDIHINMPALGHFPSQDIVLKYDKKNFIFDVYKDGKREASIGEKEVIDNLNNGLYVLKSTSTSMATGGVLGIKNYYLPRKNRDRLKEELEYEEKNLKILLDMKDPSPIIKKDIEQTEHTIARIKERLNKKSSGGSMATGGNIGKDFWKGKYLTKNGKNQNVWLGADDRNEAVSIIEAADDYKELISLEKQEGKFHFPTSESMETGGGVKTDLFPPKFGINTSNKWMAIVYEEGVVKDNEYFTSESDAKSWLQKMKSGSMETGGKTKEDFKIGDKVKYYIGGYKDEDLAHYGTIQSLEGDYPNYDKRFARVSGLGDAVEKDKLIKVEGIAEEMFPEDAKILKNKYKSWWERYDYLGAHLEDAIEEKDEAKIKKLKTEMDELESKMHRYERNYEKGGKTDPKLCVGDIYHLEDDKRYYTIINDKSRGGGSYSYQSDKDGAPKAGAEIISNNSWLGKSPVKVGHIDLEQVTRNIGGECYQYYKSGNKDIDIEMANLDARWTAFSKNATEAQIAKYDKQEDMNHHFENAKMITDWFNDRMESGGKIEMAQGGKVGGRGFFGLKKGKRITSPEELEVGDIILDHSDQFNADNTIKITDRRTYGTIVHISGIYWNPITNKRIGDEEFGVAPELGGSKYYFPESKNISKGNWEVSVGDIYQVGDMQYKIINGNSRDKVEYLTKWATEKEWDPNSGGSLSINNFAVKGLFNDKTRIHPANKKSKKKK